MNEFSTIIGLIIYSQVVLIPICGLILLGMRNERINRDRQMRELMKSLQIISISRGRHIRK